jgi:hypothetical protein
VSGALTVVGLVILAIAVAVVYIFVLNPNSSSSYIQASNSNSSNTSGSVSGAISSAYITPITGLQVETIIGVNGTYLASFKNESAIASQFSSNTTAYNEANVSGEWVMWDNYSSGTPKAATMHVVIIAAQKPQMIYDLFLSQYKDQLIIANASGDGAIYSASSAGTFVLKGHDVALYYTAVPSTGRKANGPLALSTVTSSMH